MLPVMEVVSLPLQERCFLRTNRYGASLLGLYSLYMCMCTIDVHVCLFLINTVQWLNVLQLPSRTAEKGHALRA